MAMTHEFILVSQEEINMDDIFVLTAQADHERVVKISDDIIDYIQDTLRWVPTYNPSTSKHQTGLNYNGVSVIDEQGAEIFLNILKAWVLLFTQAPEVIKLTGNYTYSAGESDASGKYEKHFIKKQEIVDQLNKLITFCTDVMKGGSKIIYLGI